MKFTEFVLPVIKKLSLPVTAIIILIGYLVISQECRREKDCPPEGYVLVTEGFIDTLQMIAEMPPEIVTNTITIKGDVVYLPGKEVPVPVPLNPQTNFYTDSIVNDSISVWVAVTVKGIITDWKWKYQPVIHKTETTIKKPVPYPVPYEVPVSRNGIYVAMGFGGNESAFMLSPEANLLTKKNNLYGIQYIRYDQNNFYLFKIGKLIKLRR